ncbi:MAG: hypothetical protein H6706_30785 [Myxococcales bacterium]|nr:hypothetical protein [Myxococcales bacterium]
MIAVARPRPAWLAYHVLAHLDLGADAASLYDPRLPDRPWRAALAEALATDADPLRAQFIGLRAADVAQLGLGDGPLGAAWRAALDAEAPAIEAALDLDDPRAREARFAAEVEPDLARARDALWGGRPPPLVILDVPALGRRARAMTLPGGERRVATSLAAPADHLLCQILHEEVHPHSDALVRAALGGLGGRDTRVDQPGFALHQALEVAAVEGGRQIIERVLPGRAAAYRAWCARHGH